ncbi:MAG: phosphate ABC transporter ATP-binding protein PstB [Candidatus Kapabacteria bacterium]|nr:phosphate ABC transporter ATP-binding protein PstB [Candidatus Kapabacteria bacterium]
MKEVKIKIESLSVSYGNKPALKDVSLNISKNQVTALIGPSGCGKTTFLKTINRLNDFNDSIKISGKVLIDGVDIYSKNTNVTELRKKTGMIFQKSNPFPKSIFDNVAYGPRVNGITNKDELYEIVKNCLIKAAIWEEVENNLYDSALKLSGGQQQRVCIARALAVNPEILLMDEPASALDPLSTARIEELILELKKNYTIIIVTHNMQQAARVSDMTAFFYMGELIEYDKTRKIFTNPSKRQTEDYITGRYG